ncbi:hypothetical protein [Faecalibacillus intestinalis]|uniref:hypothetical protein n=1 Tax=Faecalibacillus intestinalis TaxID=1982626 RepID=UPI0039956FFF
MSEIFADKFLRCGLENLGDLFSFKIKSTNYVKIDGYDMIWNVLSLTQVIKQ